MIPFNDSMRSRMTMLNSRAVAKTALEVYSTVQRIDPALAAFGTFVAALAQLHENGLQIRDVADLATNYLNMCENEHKELLAIHDCIKEQAHGR